MLSAPPPTTRRCLLNMSFPPPPPGKSTSINMLTGFLEPSKGTAMIEGLDIRKDVGVGRAGISSIVLATCREGRGEPSNSLFYW